MFKFGFLGLIHVKNRITKSEQHCSWEEKRRRKREEKINKDNISF